MEKPKGLVTAPVMNLAPVVCLSDFTVFSLRRFVIGFVQIWGNDEHA